MSWIRRLIFFHRKRHPKEMGSSEIEQFLSWLAVRRRVSASTQNHALSALLFLYRRVRQTDLGTLPTVVRARTPERLPVVLSRPEVAAQFKQLAGTMRLIALLFCMVRGSGWESVWRSAQRTWMSTATRSS